MAALKKRLCASAILSILSLISLMMLLPRAHMDRLQKITLGSTIDLGGTIDGIWKWGNGEIEDDKVEETGGGIRLVVFGDSWVDDSLEREYSGKGKSWVEVLCEQINCTSRINFARSQLASAFPSFEPAGVATSNDIHLSSQHDDQSIPDSSTITTIPLPDLATQIQSFISLPVPKEAPRQTIFVFSFGFWDVYEFSRLDLAIAQKATDRSIDEIFRQLDILYLHYVETLYPVLVSADGQPQNATEGKPHPAFRIIVPRLFDPTLTPGWLTQRPLPVSPSSIAEQQKNAVYITERWNSIMENRMGGWIHSPPPVPAQAAAAVSEGEKSGKAGLYEVGTEISRTDIRHPQSSNEVPSEDNIVRFPAMAPALKSPYPEKDIFYHDTPTYLLSRIVEHNLQREGITDGNGLGKSDSPFESVYKPCVREAEAWEGREEGAESFEEKDGMLVCSEPESFLFWDAWNLGSKAKVEIGREVGEMVMEGKSLRRAWEGIGKPNE